MISLSAGLTRKTRERISPVNKPTPGCSCLKQDDLFFTGNFCRFRTMLLNSARPDGRNKDDELNLLESAAVTADLSA